MLALWFSALSSSLFKRFFFQIGGAKQVALIVAAEMPLPSRSASMLAQRLEYPWQGDRHSLQLQGFRVMTGPRFSASPCLSRQSSKMVLNKLKAVFTPVEFAFEDH